MSARRQSNRSTPSTGSDDVEELRAAKEVSSILLSSFSKRGELSATQSYNSFPSSLCLSLGGSPRTGDVERLFTCKGDHFASQQAVTRIRATLTRRREGELRNPWIAN